MHETKTRQTDAEQDGNVLGAEDVEAILGEQPPDELLECMVAVLDNLSPPKKDQGQKR